MKIALYGGSFNPPHIGHRKVVKWLIPHFDQVWVIPCMEHTLGKKLTPLNHRVSMVRGMLLDLEKDDTMRVIPRPESRSYDLLTNLQAEHPKYEFTIVVGSDIIEESHLWYRWEQLLPYFLFVGRRGHLVPGYAFPLVLPGYNSTAIREALAQSLPHKHLPDLVWEYIQAHHLYGS